MNVLLVECLVLLYWYNNTYLASTQVCNVVAIVMKRISDISLELSDGKHQDMASPCNLLND